MAKKPVEQRTHKKHVEALRSKHTTPPKRVCNHPRKVARRAKAEERAAAWSKLSTEQKLEELRARPGECKAQIERLLNPKKTTARVIDTQAVQMNVAEEPASKVKKIAKTDVKAQKAAKRKQEAKV